MQAQLNQWLELVERELEPAVGVLILLTNQLAEVQEAQTAKAKEAVLRVGKQLDERLKLNTFLVGSSLSIADISAYYSWNEVSAFLEKESKSLPNLQRWAKHIASIPKN
jgi:glutathione S-transferase